MRISRLFSIKSYIILLYLLQSLHQSSQEVISILGIIASLIESYQASAIMQDICILSLIYRDKVGIHHHHALQHLGILIPFFWRNAILQERLRLHISIGISLYLT